MSVLTSMPASMSDALYVADRLHADDRAELELLGFNDYADVLAEHVTKSDMCFAVLVNLLPVAVGGVVGEGKIGSLWMFTTEDSREHPVALARALRRVFYDSLKNKYALLDAYVHDGHEAAKGLMRFLDMHLVAVAGVGDSRFNMYRRTCTWA